MREEAQIAAVRLAVWGDEDDLRAAARRREGADAPHRPVVLTDDDRRAMADSLRAMGIEEG